MTTYSLNSDATSTNSRLSDQSRMASSKNTLNLNNALLIFSLAISSSVYAEEWKMIGDKVEYMNIYADKDSASRTESVGSILVRLPTNEIKKWDFDCKNRTFLGEEKPRPIKDSKSWMNGFDMACRAKWKIWPW